MVSPLVKQLLATAGPPQGVPAAGESGFPRRFMQMSVACLRLYLFRYGQPFNPTGNPGRHPFGILSNH
jgi:hypothetical protein